MRSTDHFGSKILSFVFILICSSVAHADIYDIEIKQSSINGVGVITVDVSTPGSVVPTDIDFTYGTVDCDESSVTGASATVVPTATGDGPGPSRLASIGFTIACGDHTVILTDDVGKSFSAQCIANPTNPPCSDDTGVYETHNQALSVPEPGTWMLMISGLALISVILRRRANRLNG